MGMGVNTDLGGGGGEGLTLTWYWLFLEVVMEAVTGEQVEAHPWGHPPCSAPPLQGIGLGHPHSIQTLHPLTGVIPGNKNQKNADLQNYMFKWESRQ